MSIVYVTGNVHKAKYFSKMVGLPIEHKKADIDEIQSLDMDEVILHKVKQAYRQLHQPVIVEDTSLIFCAMGRLPGTLIKWFLEQLGPDGLCKLASAFEDRRAVASAIVAYYDGKIIKIFRDELEGTISAEPQGSSGFGWNVVFVPNGQSLTLGQMDAETFEHHYKKIKPFDKVREFLDKNKT